MQYQLFYNKLFRIPFKKALELVKEYEEKYKFKTFAEQQKVLDLITQKGNFSSRVKEKVMREAIMYVHFASGEKSEFSKVAFDELKKYPMAIWIELIGVLDEERIIKLLKNYSHRMPSSIIELCIINVREEIQSILIKQYSKRIDEKGAYYKNFYFSVGEDARNTLDNLYPDIMNFIPLLKLEDIEEKDLYEFIGNNIDTFKKLGIDELVEQLLLKTDSGELILDILLDYFKDSLDDISNEKFEFLITRYMYVRERYHRSSYSWFDDEDEEKAKYEDEDLLRIFENRFKKLGLLRTLSLFKVHAGYDGNKFGEQIIYNFLSDAYESEEFKPYVNDIVKKHLIVRFDDECRNKEYTIEEFYKLVDKIDLNRDKLIYDDFIEAMIACGKLMEDRVINDKNEYFIYLRNMFKEHTMKRVIKDGTYLDDVNLNGVFYRLVKGKIPFEKFYLTNTYKGIIYLSKSGTLVDDADTITQFLTDEQVFKLDVSPMLRWKREKVEDRVLSESNAFFERMSLQLLLFFGELRAKHILEAGIKGNRMENLFDGIDYKKVLVDEKGKPITNTLLMEFLFGKGSVKESQSIMNKMIREEIPDFEKYFVELCNDYENLVEKCNGVLSVKRLIRHFEDVELPVILRPDQYKYKMALKEMNTQNQYLLEKAVRLCDRCGERKFSTIPKVKGTLGDFSYEILDYNDPFAIAVGYLSHCCFVVDGISHTALEHSMMSQNGRTFVVYYKNKFLTQSWVWRNGDVVCFDSVEAGSSVHGAYDDRYNLVDVYKRAASEILYESKECEDDLQQVKVVTVGKSDYRFRDLEIIDENVARPLEQDVYVYDSRIQYVLAGKMPEKVHYGEVGAQYRDDRGKVKFIKEVSESDVDTLDEAFNQLYSIKYQVTGDEMPPVITDYKKIVLGDDWYITIDEFGTVDYGVITKDDRAYDEFKKYAEICNINISNLEKIEGPCLVKKGGN